MKSFFIIIFALLFSAQANDKHHKHSPPPTTPPTSVVLDPILPEASYTNSFKGHFKKTLNFPVSNFQSTDQFLLKIVNADGKPHEIEKCSGNLFQKLKCLAGNLLDLAYINIYRVNEAKLILNGKKIVSGGQLNKHTAKYESYIKLQAQNELKIEFEGSPKAYMSIAIYRLVKDAVPPSIMASINSNTYTNQKPVNVTIDDISNVSSEVYINNNLALSSNLKSFSFNLISGVNQIQIKSKDQYGNSASPLVISNVTLDQAAPILSLSSIDTTFYVNSFPKTVSIQVSANEKLKSLTVNSQNITLDANNLANVDVQLTQAGSLNIEAVGVDLANNSNTQSFVLNVILDNTSPIITFGLAPNTLTNQSLISIPIAITEQNDVHSQILVNGEDVLRTSAKNFNFEAELKLEGENQIKIISTDIAGNITESVVLKIIRDTIAPVLTITSPLANQQVQDIQFTLSGTFNEEVSNFFVNSTEVLLSADKKSFSMLYLSQYRGIQTISFSAKDLAGNVSEKTIQIEISSPLLVPELISVTQVDDKVLIHGAIQAARPGLTIKASEGFLSFNFDEKLVNPDGSFTLVLTPFQSATVSIEDPRFNQKATTIVSFSGITKLSGIIRDINDVPIPNVTVSITGSNTPTLTNAQGAFSFELNISGDQILSFDGSTVPQAFTGPNRFFSKSSMSINLGYAQQNILERPIYLTPTLLDGTQTQISINQSAVGTSPHAPGVQLTIPANSTVFPSGATQGSINIMTIPSDKVTIPVPASAVPSQVISLEPSGTKFTQRVDLTLPNIYQLPANTDLAIFSMNSSTGSWEIDGIAKISSDGQTIKTLPNQGISHFSIVYAVPLMPTLTGLSDSKLNAMDSSKDSYQSTVELPSFKIADDSITPQLIYKSNWANPTAYVSNYIEIPEKKISYSKSVSTSTSGYKSVKVGETCAPITNQCWDRYADFYYNTFYNSSIQQTSAYVPTGIKSQFFISTLRSSDVATGNISTDFVTSSSEIFDDGERKGLMSKIANFENLDQFQSLPLRNMVSYSVELKDPTSEKYLESGLYPSLARYQIQLRNITLKTTQQHDYVKGNFDSSYIPVKYKNYYENLVNEKKTTLESQVLQDFLPKDVSSNVIVQNKVTSEGGRGWKINGNQIILNPASRNIVIEESDGSVSTYELNNTISTVYKPENAAIKLDQAIDFSQWPRITTSYKSSDGKSYLGELDLAQPNPQINGIIEVNEPSGYLGNQGTYACIDSNYLGTFSTKKHPYRFLPKLGKLVKVSNNKWIATDIRTHRVLEISNLSKDLAGKTLDIDSVLKINYGFERIDGENSTVNQICQNVFGNDCESPIIDQSNISCTLAKVSDCAPGTICKIVPVPTFIVSSGIGYLPSFDGDNSPGLSSSNPNQIGLNSPEGIAVDTQNNIFIADYGNNRIRKIDGTTGTISTIAGSGENYDFPENPTTALTTPIYHPKQLLLNSQNELIISTEKGLILKLDALGNISKIAGLPVNQGGVYANQTNAKAMALNNPSGMALDETNNFLYIADTGFHRIVRVDLINNQADVIAGNGSCNLQSTGDGLAATNASLCSPTDLILDQDKNLIVQESGRNSIRMIKFNDSQSTEKKYLANNKDMSTLTKKSDGTWLRQFRDGSQIIFNDKGLQISTIDRVGRQNSYSYDSDAKLIKITFFTNQEINYTYSGGQLSSITDASGKKTYFNYSNGNLIKVNYPDGSEKNFTYDNKGLMLSEQNQMQQKLEIEYSVNNRVNKVKLPDTKVVNWTDAISKTLTNGTNDASLLGGVGLNSNQSNSQIIDANGGTSVLVPDINGYTSIAQDAIGRQTTITRDFDGTTNGIIKPNGQSTHYIYSSDTKDLILTKEFYDLDTDPIEKRFTYNIYGQITSETTSARLAADQIIQKEYFPTTGLLSKITTSQGNKIEVTYDTLGLVKSRTVYPINNSSGLTTTYQRNQFGWVTKSISPDGKEIIFNYDSSGNIIEKIENISSNLKATTKYEFDTNNRLIKVVSPNNETTLYNYDLLGNLLSITDPKNKTTTFEYNNRNKLIKKIDAFGSITEMSYDGNGNLISLKDPNGNIRTMQYDSVNQLLEVNLPDDVVKYVYGVNDSPDYMSNKNSEIYYLRNMKGQTISESISGLGSLNNHPGMSISNEFNPRDLLTKQYTNVGNIIYNYDEGNRLTNMNAFSKNYNFSYDSANRLTNLSRGNLNSEFSYQDQSLKMIKHSSSGVSLTENEYAYDLRHYPVQKRTLASVSSYSYDLNGQLTQNSSSDSTLNETFSYDGLGNRLTDSSKTYDYDISGQRLVQDTFFTYQYDNNGNLINKISRDGLKESQHYDYSSLNQLIKVQVLTGTIGSLAIQKEVSYAYDVLGRRMQKEVKDFVNKVTYIRKYAYNGNNIIGEYDGNNALLAKFAHSPLSADDILAAEFTTQGKNIGLSSQTGVVYYLKDHLNSVTDIVDESGNIIQKYEYSSFGEIRKIKNSNNDVVAFNSAPIKTSFTYTGREFDSETGLYYYRARYYDASVGRFLQQDPDPGKLRMPASFINSYIYVQNRPTLMVDPNGKFPLLVAIVVAGAIGGIVGGYNASRNGMSFWSGFASGAAIGVASVAATAAGAAIATYLFAYGGLSVGAGSFWGVAAGAIGGAIGNAAFYGGILGAKGSSLFLSALAGALSGGIGGAYGANIGQGGPISPANQVAAVEGVDSFNRTITPIDISNDPTNMINDFFIKNPDGSWTNGAPSMDGPSVYRP